ncbi:hypothetical protein H8S61_02945 [Eggerthella sp. NSJ-70]|uniref:Uncharacterized protein n=1 Tax=Eggerthella hominis TaxID=2763043 RepID=A0ABR7BNI1_9ACTN|nr:hypothetical protein [Eggerthella hominis]MBC5583159.1 hypothetical protein [Eggerthella hominis]
MLVADDYRSNINDVIAKKSSSIDRLYVFGGPAAVSDDVYRSIVNALAYWLCNEVEFEESLLVKDHGKMKHDETSAFDIARAEVSDRMQSV